MRASVPDRVNLSKLVSGLLLLGLALNSASYANPLNGVDRVPSVTDPISAKFLPGANKVLLILGQGLDSIFGYVDSGYFSIPAGVTSYLAF